MRADMHACARGDGLPQAHPVRKCKCKCKCKHPPLPVLLLLFGYTCAFVVDAMPLRLSPCRENSCGTSFWRYTPAVSCPPLHAGVLWPIVWSASAFDLSLEAFYADIAVFQIGLGSSRALHGILGCSGESRVDLGPA